MPCHSRLVVLKSRHLAQNRWLVVNDKYFSVRLPEPEPQVQQLTSWVTLDKLFNHPSLESPSKINLITGSTL